MPPGISITSVGKKDGKCSPDRLFPAAWIQLSHRPCELWERAVLSLPLALRSEWSGCGHIKGEVSSRPGCVFALPERSGGRAGEVSGRSGTGCRRPRRAAAGERCEAQPQTPKTPPTFLPPPEKKKKESAVYRQDLTCF